MDDAIEQHNKESTEENATERQMKITVCDICEAKDTSALMLWTGETQPDVAGGRSEHIYKRYDLCADHIRGMLMELLLKHPAQQQELIQYLEKVFSAKGTE